MQKNKKIIEFIGMLGVLLLLLLSGCAQKTVKLEPAAEETAVVADTTGAKSPEVSKETSPETASSSNTASPSGTEGAGPAESLETPVTGQNESAAMSGAGLAAAGVVPGSRTDLGFLPIYFDYDKSLIRQDQVTRMTANALYLKSNPKIKVRIEGNCDERGTNEYNLALGERRAMGAKKYLVNLGIAEARIGILSYGEERPVNLGHDEAAWAANRRGDFVIVQ